jgi:hypothetical protein
VTGDDHARLGDRADELTVFVGNKAFMRMIRGHCAALEIHDDGRFLCSVYTDAPRDLPRARARLARVRGRAHERKVNGRSSRLKRRVDGRL